ncbi:NAD(P)/FAD-dependent oxidoreductase [Haloglycomyces albus]|uniref:NAD(P)/FAD-dependent oxidoreductase n=1 Tax=Haloglycomyces albus TaxID=526067 RepID=UPI00046D3430|nr:FAD-dependent oxidoreductase [Haloglycomyces albus]
MKHRIVVLGAGYSGAHAASRIARRLRREDVEVTLVNAEPDFVERVRLHQIAAGQDLLVHRLDELFAGTGVRLRIDRVTGLDVEDKKVATETGELRYDTLIYSLGSFGRTPEGTYSVADYPGALRLRKRLSSLGDGERVPVVGGGLTGLEAATEIAETRPGLAVTLATAGELGDWLAPGARRHLRQVVAKLGITLEENRVVDPGETGATTVWCTGFTASTLAEGTALETDADGRIKVDETMQSTSHPDVYAIGDSACAPGPRGQVSLMRCGAGVPQAWQAAGAITARLTGRKPRCLPLGYVHQAISLGRKESLIQFVTWDDRPRRGFLTGRAGAHYKELVCRFAVNAIRWPQRMPGRRRAVTTTPALDGDQVHT